MDELVAQGSDLSELPKYESLFSEGDRGELRLYLEQPATQEELQEMQDIGVVLTEPIAQDAGVMVIKFEKRVAPLVIFAGAILVAVVGWQLLKTVSEVPIWAWVAGAIGVVMLLRRK